MYLKREKEFQYHPGIEKIIEDVIGGGTIDRSDFKGVLFDGASLPELPPLVIVVQDPDTRIYKTIKTAKVSAVATATATVYQVKKNHLFAVGDAVTNGGDFTKAADIITAIDKSDKTFDLITLDGTIGAAAVGDILVLAKEAAEAGDATMKYDGELVVTMNKVDLTVANQRSGLLVRGTINKSVLPFPIDNGLKAKLPFIRFV